MSETKSTPTSTSTSEERDDSVVVSLVEKGQQTNAKKSEQEKAPTKVVDLEDPELYLNRELTWLKFNRRVLNEAQDERTALLERVKFLAISASNLDEFFMKRIGGLKQQVGAGVHDLTVDGRTPQQQINECIEEVHDIQGQMRQIYLGLLKKLSEHGITIAQYDKLESKKKAALREQFVDNIFPLLTPLAIDPAHPFPFISNLSLNLLVTLKRDDSEERVLTRVKVPSGSGVPRFMRVPDTYEFVPLSSVIAHNLDLLFPDMDILSVELFRVIRNANTERDEEAADDLLAMIESELRDRKFAPIVRLETQSGINPVHRGMLCAELGLNEDQDVYESDTILGMKDLMEIAFLDIPDLHDPDHHPISNVKLQDTRNIFHIIRESGPILLHHPYESFATSVVRLVREASRDPKVRAIKMTLYRTSSDTKIIEYLIEAARNGKQVAVVVELKARFDEEANIRWASRLEEFGIHVTYGVVGLKTHSKTTLVVRQDYDGLRRYAHIGTGNYHAGTARLYTDLGLLTCDSEIGSDLTELFNYLTTGCKPSRKYKKILTTPKVLKKELIKKIAREAELSSPRAPGLIRFKCNALEDPDIAKALYEASAAGVKIELVIRDTCRVRPGIPGISDNISVIGIVGQFLEHARIYYFRNGGAEEYFIGSADLMRRNLESRVEVVTPIEDKAHQAELKAILDIQLKDHRSAWDMQSNGAYVQRTPGRSQKKESCQYTLVKRAEKRHGEANRLRKRRPKGFARRSSV